MHAVLRRVHSLRLSAPLCVPETGSLRLRLFVSLSVVITTLYRWLVAGTRAMEDGRRERHEAVADGTIVESSSDESDPTDSSSSSGSEDDTENQRHTETETETETEPSLAELEASTDVGDASASADAVYVHSKRPHKGRE